MIETAIQPSINLSLFSSTFSIDATLSHVWTAPRHRVPELGVVQMRVTREARLTLAERMMAR
jgi:hypothetical protein